MSVPGAASDKGTSRLAGLFRDSDHALLIPYATGGYPDIEGCRRIVDAYIAGGANIIELGIPFSDPLADGPVIQATSTIALRTGVRPQNVLDIAGGVTRDGASVILLSYLNTAWAMGPERFFGLCREAGVLGVVVPDLPVDEAAELQAVARSHEVDVILLAAPTSTDARLDMIADAAAGFIYCVSMTGVTGARDAVRTDLPQFIDRLRARTDLPLAVGFGVSTAQQAGEIGAFADGVIIGSRLMRTVQESRNLEDALRGVESFVAEARAALRSGDATL